jgi:cyclophilin family peptidyl-prolyl cis-trans isomerase
MYRILSTLDPYLGALTCKSEANPILLCSQAGEAPNGTSFVVTRDADPSLDATCLIVGRVKAGMDVVEVRERDTLTLTGPLSVQR